MYCWVGFLISAVKYFSKLKFCIYDCPRHGREDEDGVDSDSCGSDAESEDEHVVRPYEHDPKLKCKEELEHFSQGCDNVIQSESDSEEENVDYASWQGTRKVYSLCACVRQYAQPDESCFNK